MSLGLTGLQQYINVMHKLSYDANDKRRLGKKKNEGQLEKALEKAYRFFFPCFKNVLATVVTIAQVSTSAQVVRSA